MTGLLFVCAITILSPSLHHVTPRLLPVHEDKCLHRDSCLVYQHQAAAVFLLHTFEHKSITGNQIMLSSGNSLIPNKCFEPPGGSKLVITRKTSNSKSICLVPHHASEINSSVFVFPSHLMSNTHIVYAILPYVALLFNNVFFTLRHRPPPVFTPLLINTSARFLFAPSFHFICFWSTRIFQGGSCTQAVKIHPRKCSKATPLLFLLSCEGGGASVQIVFDTFFSFWSGWPSIRTTVHVPPGCLSPWQPESGRPQQEDGGKMERRLRRNTRCTVSVNTLNVHRTSSALNRRNKNRERMEPKKGDNLWNGGRKSVSKCANLSKNVLDQQAHYLSGLF